jgi:hypothetical protein
MNGIIDFETGSYKFGENDLDLYVKEYKGGELNHNQITALIKNKGCIKTEELFSTKFLDDMKYIRGGIEYCVLPLSELVMFLERFENLPFRHIEIKYNTKKKTAIAYIYQTDEETGEELIRFLTDEELYYYAKT